jgi:hypothetical protein
MALGQPTPLREERTTGERDFPSWSAPILTMALQVLDRRILLWLVTVGAGAVWSVTVMHPDPWRIVAASLYSLLVLAPFILLERGR